MNSQLRIGVDLDEVLDSLLFAWVKVLCERTGEYVDPRFISTWNFRHYFNRLSVEDYFAPLRERDFWKSVTTFPGSELGMKFLLENFDKVYIVTATSKETMPIKIDWLHGHFPFFDTRNIIRTSVKQNAEVDVLIDDFPDNLVNAKYESILLRKSYNQEFANQMAQKKGIYVADNWEEICGLIQYM